MEKSTKVLINGVLVLLGLYIFYLLQDFLSPIYQTILLFLTPLIIGIYAYYALKPIQRLLAKVLKNQTLVAFLTFLFFLLLLFIMVFMIGKVLLDQATSFIQSISFEELYEENKAWIDYLNRQVDFQSYANLAFDRAKAWASQIPDNLSSYLGSVSSLAGNISTLSVQFIITILSILYLLKDGHQVEEQLVQLTRGRHEKTWQGLFKDINKILEIYVSGQMLISLILGILSFIGYLLIGLPNALLLAVISLITNLIPYIGPIIGTIPAMVIGLTGGPMLALKALLVSLVVQQLESNVVSPNIMGQKLDVHPFIIMVVILAAMQLFGIIGALIASPMYLILVHLVRALTSIFRASQQPAQP